MLSFIKTTVLGGMLFLVPVVVLIAIVGKGLQLTSALAAPIGELLGVDTIAGVAVVELLAVGVLVLICFLAGLVAETPRAKRWVRSLEENLLEKIPTYQLLKTKAQSALEFENSERLQTVKVRFDDSWQLAFEMRRTDSGDVVLFLPGAPDPWSGSICIVTADRVEKLDMTVRAVVKLLKSLGRGPIEAPPVSEDR